MRTGLPHSASWIGLICITLVTSTFLRGESGLIAAARPGRVETGAPSFVVLGPEALGLSTGVSDIELMPDGRILAVARRELAFGDGVRWETFRSADDTAEDIQSVAVENDGRIYAGVGGAIARIDLVADRRWRPVTAISLPQNSAFRDATMIAVTPIRGTWYWYPGSGVIMTWRPGQPMRVLGNVASIERIFSLGDQVFASDQSSGTLFRLQADSGTSERIAAADALASETVTAAVPFSEGKLLVGTSSAGLKLFDGAHFLPFRTRGLLAEGHRINDLCAAGPDDFAAAVDGVGIVFFDRRGQPVQVLERSLDHRLARVKRLLYAPNGVLWALLNEGLARVYFPSPISSFEPQLGTSMVYARPFRHAGDIWLLADGRGFRGVYSAADRLERLEPDSPPGRFVFALGDVGGTLFGSSNTGAYIYNRGEWERVFSDVVNTRFVAQLSPHEWLYVARGEYGILEKTETGYARRRISEPRLHDTFNSVSDTAGTIWLELGSGSVGRLDPNGGHPVLQILGSESGLLDGWVEIYTLDGIARFHQAQHVFRFDPSAKRFVNDAELLARYPQLQSAVGRPIRDPQGRLWYTANGTINVLHPAVSGNAPVISQVRAGFAPIEYTVEQSGVVWAFATGRLARIDLNVAMPAPVPVRALISSVHLPISNRSFFRPRDGLGTLPYADNSLIFNFAAPANPFAGPITFEVLLEGSGGADWVPAGTLGSAAYSRLKEGHYLFHVRPVVAGVRGREATLAFAVLPPWYRTRLAWTLYVLGGLGLVALSAWVAAFLQRRENERLERVVAIRTGELHAANVQLSRQIQETTRKSEALAASEERFRALNSELERRVEERTAELKTSNQELAKTSRNLIETSRMAGMAEVATGVLHNIGNVLNSLNVSSGVIAGELRQSKIERLDKIVALLDQHRDDLGEFLTRDPKGKLVPEYLATLAQHTKSERDWLRHEIASMQKNIDHIKEIVTMQQEYATVAGIVDTLEPAALFEDALRMNEPVLQRHRITVVREFQPVAPVVVEKGKVLQILTNLIRNALHACDDAGIADKKIILRLEPGSDNRVRFVVGDNGVGIPPENLTRIFSLGFTTRSYGHGFGLHASALAAKEMKGSLVATSDGPGRGATFTLDLPGGPRAAADGANAGAKGTNAAPA